MSLLALHHLPEPDTPRPGKITSTELDEFRDLVHRRLDPRIQLCLRVHDGEVILDLIQVLYPLRGRGLARATLSLLCAYADDRGWVLALQPSATLGSDILRLRDWYSSHGFRVTGSGLSHGQIGWMSRIPLPPAAPRGRLAAVEERGHQSDTHSGDRVEPDRNEQRPLAPGSGISQHRQGKIAAP